MTNRIETSIEGRGGDIAVVHLSGRLDFTSAIGVKRTFAEAVSAGLRRVVVDLSDVSFVDSSGLSALVSGLRTTRQAGGDLRIAAVGEQPSTLLALTSLDQIFRLYPTVEAGLHGFED